METLDTLLVSILLFCVIAAIFLMILLVVKWYAVFEKHYENPIWKNLGNDTWKVTTTKRYKPNKKSKKIKKNN
jgi:hypothetical protein